MREQSFVELAQKANDPLRERPLMAESTGNPVLRERQLTGHRLSFVTYSKLPE